ncbi:hypothetical protein [Mycoplasma hafezii]|uniref:hypothetical protein n=1 Tax=Mycoplasma hafezii TaxID=525886 RepID=UPI003CF350CC
MFGNNLDNIISQLKHIQSVGESLIPAAIVIAVVFAIIGLIMGFLGSWRWVLGQSIMWLIVGFVCWMVKLFGASLAKTLVINNITGIPEEAIDILISVAAQVYPALIIVILIWIVIFVDAIWALIIIIRRIAKRGWFKGFKHAITRLIMMPFGLAFGALTAGASMAPVAYLTQKSSLTTLENVSTKFYSLGSAYVSPGLLPNAIEMLEEIKKNEPIIEKVINGEYDKLTTEDKQNAVEAFTKLTDIAAENSDILVNTVKQTINQIDFDDLVKKYDIANNINELRKVVQDNYREYLNEKGVDTSTQEGKDKLTLEIAKDFNEMLTENKDIKQQTGWIFEIVDNVYNKVDNKTKAALINVLTDVAAKVIGDSQIVNNINVDLLITQLLKTK